MSKTKLDPATTPKPADPPAGQMWQCPDCKSGASLPENAWFHRLKTGHGEPTLAPLPPGPRNVILEPGDVVIDVGLRKRLRRALGPLRECSRDPEGGHTQTVYMHLPAKPDRDAIKALIRLIEDEAS